MFKDVAAVFEHTRDVLANRIDALGRNGPTAGEVGVAIAGLQAVWKNQQR